MAAFARCFATGVRLRHLRKFGHPQLVYRGRIGFTCVTARTFAAQRLRRTDCSPRRSVGYMLNGQLHDQLLSADEFDQDEPPEPRALAQTDIPGAPESRRKPLTANCCSLLPLLLFLLRVSVPSM